MKLKCFPLVRSAARVNQCEPYDGATGRGTTTTLLPGISRNQKRSGSKEWSGGPGDGLCLALPGIAESSVAEGMKRLCCPTNFPPPACSAGCIRRVAAIDGGGFRESCKIRGIPRRHRRHSALRNSLIGFFPRGDFVVTQAPRFGVVTFLFAACCCGPLTAAEKADFSSAVIVIRADADPVVRKAVAVLQEEVEKRTGLALAITAQWPAAPRAAIAIGLESHVGAILPTFTDQIRQQPAPAAEGFHLSVHTQQQSAALIAGKDVRGVLYGVGMFLRKSEWKPGSLQVPTMSMATAPKYPLRGHQLGYRPKTNAYDAWSHAQFDQYIRELALFGTNSIELIPPVSDDDRTSRHMKLPAMEMMTKVSASCDAYGLDVWIWYPNVGEDYVSEEGIEFELKERDEVLGKLPRVDHLLVPAGDPGHLHPDVFFPFMDRLAPILKKHHPHAKIWVAPQAFRPTRAWLDVFYDYINRRPDWLGGVVFAPWVKTPIAEMRDKVDASIPLRRYPDITHSVAAQYPVKEWDLAFALTYHRESYNPRPLAMKAIHNAFDEYAAGTITYSEGINDDVNKFVWSGQDWNPGEDVIETLRDFSRLFISSRHADSLAQGYLAQERNWEGPLAVNSQVETTLAQWRRLEEEVSDFGRAQYRFEMGLLRAYYDAYTKRRLIYETELELRARDVLRTAARIGSTQAIASAEKILSQATQRVATDYRSRCLELGESLHQKIGSQLTVEGHGAQNRVRGAFLDGLDEPLNEAEWLTEEFKRIGAIANESARVAAIEALLARQDPGPGGFYDDLGAAGSTRRIVNTVPWEKDPGTLISSRIAYDYRMHTETARAFPLAWKRQAYSIYESELNFAYDGLDPEANYRLRVVYGTKGEKIRLVADSEHEIHGLIDTAPKRAQEFAIPHEATADGELKLTWSCGEAQRGVQVSEIWLLKTPYSVCEKGVANSE